MKKYVVIAASITLAFALVFPVACAKPKPAEFVISDLDFTPTEAEVGEQVKITAKVRNIGELEGTYTGILRINGMEVERKDVAVVGGETKTIDFAIVRNFGPSCNVEVNEISKTLTVKEGLLPTLRAGDKWVYRIEHEDIEYKGSQEIIGEDVVNGKPCYGVEGLIEPPLMGVISEFSYKIDKATMMPIRIQMTGEVMELPFIAAASYSHIYTGVLPYPLEVGKTWEITETESLTMTSMGETEKETEKNDYTYRVETVEDITVPAGTFRCFKIVQYDESGAVVQTKWISDETKGEVKLIDHETGEIDELLSYSFSP